MYDRGSFLRRVLDCSTASSTCTRALPLPRFQFSLAGLMVVDHGRGGLAWSWPLRLADFRRSRSLFVDLVRSADAARDLSPFSAAAIVQAFAIGALGPLVVLIVMRVSRSRLRCYRLLVWLLVTFAASGGIIGGD